MKHNAGHFLMKLVCLCVYVYAINNCKYDECNHCTAGLCDGCKAGSHKDNAFYYCYKCRRECKYCTAEDVCTECVDGYFLLDDSSNTKTCRKCPQSCTTCLSSSQCTSCKDGYYLQDGYCTKCVPNCQSCSSLVKCDVCERGYKNADGLCVSCSDVLCTSACQVGTYLSPEGKCERCDSRCMSCSTYSTCTSCYSGTYLTTSGTCVFCNSTTIGCTSCDTTGKCLDCERYYRLLGDASCSLCPKNYMTEGVDTCSNMDYPRNCISGYVDPYGYCEKCPANCHQCNTNNHACKNCKVGFYFSEASCLSCQLGCDYCNNKNVCTKCSEGYIRKGGYCYAQTTVDGCSYSEDVCLQCSDGYYLTPDHTCVKCNDCERCDNTKCHKCFIDSTPTVDIRNCEKCSTEISGCSICSQTERICTKCATGNVLVNSTYCGVCSLTKSHCTICSQTTNECVICDEGYTAVKGECIDFSTAVPNCLIGERGETKCLKCFPTYVLSPTRESCDKCETIENCLECNQTSFSCKKCRYMYGVNDSGLCELCTSKSVSNPTCTAVENGKCMYGLSPLDGYCHNCSEEIKGCAKCNNDNWSCEICSSLYVNRNGNCTLCDIEKCSKCNNKEDLCEICDDGYFLFNGKCQRMCTNDPSAFHVEIICVRMFTRYGLLSIYVPSAQPTYAKREILSQTLVIRVISIEGCLIGNRESDTCIQCIEGYGKNNSECVKCSIGCLSCFDNSEVCELCENSYVLQNKKCVKSVSVTCDTTNPIIGCESCSDNFRANYGLCESCQITNCMLCDNENCVFCADGYTWNESSTRCQLYQDIRCSFYTKGQCILASDGYFIFSSEYSPEVTLSSISNFKNSDGISLKGATEYASYYGVCPENCTTCIFDYTYKRAVCQSCTLGKYILKNGVCLPKDASCDISNQDGCIDCGEGFYIQNSECKKCEEIHPNCTSCNQTECDRCAEGYVLDNFKCVEVSNCVEISNSKCIRCASGFFLNGLVPICEACTINNCQQCLNTTICLRCVSQYILSSGKCYSTLLTSALNNVIPQQAFKRSVITNCLAESENGCLRCAHHYVLNKETGQCEACPEDCIKCYSPTECFRCALGYSVLQGNCTIPQLLGCSINRNGKCLVCGSGFIMTTSQECEACGIGCSSCATTSSNCLSCSENYYLINSTCISTSLLPNCITSSKFGCEVCESGYFLSIELLCKKCDIGCSSCTSMNTCESCADNYLLKNGVCLSIEQSNLCIKASSGVCISCVDGYTLQNTECIKKVKIGLIVGLVLLAVFLLIVIIAIIVVINIVMMVLKKRKGIEGVTVFKMDMSNIMFSQLEKTNICVNKRVLRFNEDNEFIAVCETTRELLCIGNQGKSAIKLQLSTVDDERYEVDITPNLCILKEGEACEFDIQLRPLCTSKINMVIKLVYIDLKRGEEKSYELKVETQTVITSKLDYEELIIEKKIGEGSFGIVYKGTFRNHLVAIKKLKNEEMNEEAIDEFEREIQMLDKFRSEYIVHFYGAVFIPKKICMVTEYATYGSIEDVVDQKIHLSDKLKLKFLWDASKGILYLHENGIIHRDIKPANILVISLDHNEKVIAKLTDFGSSRNVNMMMTNMTFTKGIGTPVYMAPEILNQDYYKTPADIFSFAITILEIMKGYEVYEKNTFVFPWNIAEFVSRGLRPSQPENVKNNVFDIVTNMWKQVPNQRWTIERVESELHTCYNETKSE
ncbi:protein serine/threonine kinase, putative [Entamoeba invadens IP1]|uniref:Protein serine/threonine kinase, putative n=1 Tax=Entamoeba invadens IP1 TaxID=370355 RepID=A0A0A1UAS6_ENTIV|nr:protein serine/threonine kinase, putative [Entamoeba invadens IP1]ELP89253.1 protein serine/threonine kinase, putative [Entamoeba invadens IP1]|eukprot:XP_004256024.1 protein serine/threonine kinase, putative [Entamoeba invadens IP1]